MKTTVVYDIETCPVQFHHANGMLDFIFEHDMTIGVTWSEEEGYKVWLNEQKDQLIHYLLQFGQIVGFNIKSFDNLIVAGHSQATLDALNERSLDMLEIIEARLGHRVSLSSIVKPTLNSMKLGNGEAAIQWWLDGEHEKVIKYCKEDVRLTKDLYLHGLLHKEIRYYSYGQERILRIDWEKGVNGYSETDFTYLIAEDHKGNPLPLDPDNEEFFRVFDLIANTNENVIITGKAGTGKTTFLRYLKQNLNKKTVVVAPTGIAAINAGGQTINSFFQIDPKSYYLPHDRRLRFATSENDQDKTTVFSTFRFSASKKELLQAMEVLIIDEISMVRADSLDVIDRVLRAFGGRRHLPFGGKQVIMIGDPCQLAPIEGPCWHILRDYYRTPYFFGSQVVTGSKPLHVELETIYRQHQRDFIDLLNRVRMAAPIHTDIATLNQRMAPLTNCLFDQGYMVLCSTNAQADAINREQLNRLPSDSAFYQGSTINTFPQQMRPAPDNLELKVGARVIFLSNGDEYYNGMLGTVTSLDDNEILVRVSDVKGRERVVRATREEWENVRYYLNEEKTKIETEVIGQ